MIGKATAKCVLLQEQYDMCYTKCVAQETDRVVEEREQVRLMRSIVPDHTVVILI